MSFQSRDLFLINIEHQEYKATKNSLKLKDASLQTCYKEIKSLSAQIEEGPNDVRRRIRNTKKDDDTNFTKPTKYMGKPLDEYGFLKKINDFLALTKDQKMTYYKKKDKLVADNLVQKKPKNPAENPPRTATVRTVETGLATL